MTHGTAVTAARTRMLVIATAILSAVALGLGVAAPAQAETWWVARTTYPVTFANGIAVTSDGATAVVSSGTTTSVSVIDISSGTSQAVAVGSVTGNVVIDSTDTYAYIASAGGSSLFRIKLSDLSHDEITVSSNPRYLMFDISNDYLYVKGDGADRVTLSDFSVITGYFNGAVPGPIVQTDLGAIYIDGTNTVQRFDQGGNLIDSFSREAHVVYAAVLSPDDNYIIGVDDNGNAYRTDLTNSTTELWIGGLGYGAGYGEILVRGNYGYVAGLLGQTVAKFSLVDASDRRQMLNLGSGYPKNLAAPADASFFLLTVPGHDEVVKYSYFARPDTPAAPTAVAGDREVTITASSANTGDAADSITITADNGGAVCYINGSSGSCTIHELGNGTAYTFTATAQNSAGDSAASAPSEPVTPAHILLAPDTPAAPTAVPGNGEATVTASAALTGDLATGMTVTAHPGDATCRIEATAGECTVDGLTNGRAYTFTVVGTNAAGSSDPSPPSTSVTPVSPGSAPTASAVTVSGTAVEGSTLSAAISNLAGTTPIDRGWTWQRKKGTGSWTDIPNAHSDTYPIKAGDIGYQLRVRVALSNELGATSVTSGATATVLSKPKKSAAPKSVTASAKQKSAKAWTITVDWLKVTSPADDPTTDYGVTCQLGKVKLAASVTGAKTSALLTATKAGTYSCTVTATRKRGGTSAASAAVKVVVK